MEPDSNIFIVTYSQYENKSVENWQDIPVIGHLEFEYWAENIVPYDTLVLYALCSFFGFGFSICCCLNICFKTGIEEQIDLIKYKVWKLRGKSKEYIQQNAPEVLEFVRLQEEAAIEGKLPSSVPGIAGEGRTKKVRIHELENELEESWCCNQGLVPVTSPCIAFFLCLMNIVVPG